ncbi:hypothetical protein EC950183_4004, partial [Escherichia coli 95.0183]|jgi:hypothetical protein
MRSP